MAQIEKRKPGRPKGSGKKPGVAGKSNSGVQNFFDPDNAESAGLLNDVKVKTLKARFERRYRSDYSEVSPEDRNDVKRVAPCFVQTVKVMAGGEPREETIIWSAGSLARVIPSKDEQQLIPAKGTNARGMSTGSNYHLYMASLKEQEFPFNKMSGASDLDGMIWHLVRVPQPKRAGLPDPEPREDGSTPKERTIPICTEIYELPAGLGKKRKPRADDQDEDQDEDADEPEDSDDDDEDADTEDSDEADEEDSDDDTEDADEDEDADEPEDSDEDADEDDSDEQDEDESAEDPIVERAQTVTLALIKEAGKKGLTASKLVPTAFAALKQDKNRRKIIAAMQAKGFLANGPWEFSKKTGMLNLP